MTTRRWTAVLWTVSLVGPLRADTPDEQLAAARDMHKEAVARAEGALVEAFDAIAKLVREVDPIV